MSSHAHKSDQWNSHSTKWTQSVQQITLAPCQDLIERVISLSSSDSPEAAFLDNGCGAGMVTKLLKTEFPKIPVTATDISAGMIEQAKETAKEENWDIQFYQSNSEDLKDLQEGHFSHVFSTFVIIFTQEPLKAYKEVQRVLQCGGAAGIANWSRISWVPLWEEAARAVRGNDYVAPNIFHGRTTELEAVEQDLKEAGFTNINVREFNCYHPDRDADTAVETFYGMGNPSTKSLMEGFSSAEIERTKPHFKEAYDRIWDGGRKRQYEVAILATGRKT